MTNLPQGKDQFQRVQNKTYQENLHKDLHNDMADSIEALERFSGALQVETLPLDSELNEVYTLLKQDGENSPGIYVCVNDSPVEYLNLTKEGCVYTNPNPTTVEVGGIGIGSNFLNTDLGKFIQRLLYPELFPTLINPYHTFTSTASGLKEIGEVIGTIIFNANFYRGAISPQYQSSSAFRSGLPNLYTYVGFGNVATSSLSDQKILNNYVVQSGPQYWSCKIAYNGGVQPKGSEGSNFGSPLPPGETIIITRTITGVYPWFATSQLIDTFTKQPLASMNSVYVEASVVVETDGFKQSVFFPQVWSAITGIQFYNTASGQWEWLNGNKANSLETFHVTPTTFNIQGNIINYNRFTHNGATIGARLLRFYTN